MIVLSLKNSKFSLDDLNKSESLGSIEAASKCNPFMTSSSSALDLINNLVLTISPAEFSCFRSNRIKPINFLLIREAIFVIMPLSIISASATAIP